MIWSPSSQTFAGETRGDLGVEAENGSRVWFQFSDVPQAPHMTLGIFLSFLQMLGTFLLPPLDGEWCGLAALLMATFSSVCPLVPGGLGCFSVLFGGCCLILQWVKLLHKLATVYSPRLSREKSLLWLCSWLRWPCLSLSVTFPHKLNSAGSQERSLLYLCATLTGWTLFTDLW